MGKNTIKYVLIEIVIYVLHFLSKEYNGNRWNWTLVWETWVNRSESTVVVRVSQFSRALLQQVTGFKEDRLGKHDQNKDEEVC